MENKDFINISIPSVKLSILRQGTPSRYQLRREERVALSVNARESRIKEFTLGRAAANDALQQLGLSDPPPIIQGKNRSPVWPENVIGSISHSEQWAIAAVAFKTNVKLIGIDIELIRPLPVKRLMRKIATPEESKLLELHPDSDDKYPYLQTLIFSAKESIYKAFYTKFGVKLRFADISFSWYLDEIKKEQVTLFGRMNRTVDKHYHEGCVIPVKAIRFMDNYVLTFFVDS